MAKFLFHLFLVLSSSFLLLACNESSSKGDTMIKSEQTSEIWHQGTVQYFEFEGGFYGVVTDKGGKYLPINLKIEYRRQGTVIRFTGKEVKDRVSIKQWGTMFQFDKVELIKLGKGGEKNTM